MQVRNLLIAAGAALAATTAIAAVPTAASAQGFYGYHPYRAERVYVRQWERPHFYGPYWAHPHPYWAHPRYDGWRFHHRGFYRY